MTAYGWLGTPVRHSNMHCESEDAASFTIYSCYHLRDLGLPECTREWILVTLKMTASIKHLIPSLAGQRGVGCTDL